jgi:hypothetical protein
LCRFIAPWKALADRGAGNVNELTLEIMVCGDFFTNADQAIRGDPEFSDLALRAHIGLGEVAALRGGGPFGLGLASAKLDGGIAIPVGGALRHDLQAVQLQDRDRNLLAVCQEQPGHAQLFCDNSRAHRFALLKL